MTANDAHNSRSNFFNIGLSVALFSTIIALIIVKRLTIKYSKEAPFPVLKTGKGAETLDECLGNNKNRYERWPC